MTRQTPSDPQGPLAVNFAGSMNKIHHVGRIAFARSRMLLTVDGKAYSCALADVSERLAHARDFERDEYEVSPSGYGIHWPLADEDLSVDGFLRAARLEPSDSSVYQSQVLAD